MKQCAIFLLIFIFATFSLAGYKLFCAFTHPIKYHTEIIEASKKYNLEPSLVASLINVESSYKEYSKSNKNAIGLMQIKLETANYVAELNKLNLITETELFNPITNIEFGCMYIQYFTHLSIDRHLGYLYLLAIMNNPAMNVVLNNL